MATNKNETAKTNEIDGAAVAAAAEKLAAGRKALLASVTYAEAVEIALGKAKWADVLAAAERLATVAKGIREPKVSATARKIGQFHPVPVASLRFAIASYALSGARMNPTQAAELGAKLPNLQTNGALADKVIKYGSLALPPMLSDL